MCSCLPCQSPFKWLTGQAGRSYSAVNPALAGSFLKRFINWDQFMAESDQNLERSVIRTNSHGSAWWVLLAIILLMAFIRYGLLDVPLERDEGEYAYGGQLILQGAPLYQQLYSMKLPGIYAAYAFILVLFGQTHTGIHFGLLIINSATIILVFFLAKRMIDSLAAAVAAASFAILSINQSVQGLFANAEHFVILPVVGGVLLLLRALDEEQPRLLFFSGLLLGLGFLMKQHGVFFIAFGVLYILIDSLLQLRQKAFMGQLALRCLLFIAGATAPYGLTCLIFYFSGWFGKFWFWTVDYARTYSTLHPKDLIWQSLRESVTRIIRSAPAIWAIAGIGLTSIIWCQQIRSRAIFILLFTTFSILAICPGFYFRSHYFILVLPAAALLSGIAISAAVNIMPFSGSTVIKYGIPIFLAAICLSATLYQQRYFLFQMTPEQVSRATYGFNPFPESIEIAEYVRSHTRKEDQIAVMGSEPQLYFYSGRRSASRYIYMYPLMENHEFAVQMQNEMISEIEKAKPMMIIFFHVETSWLFMPDSHMLLLDWINSYQNSHYNPVGLIEIFQDKTLYHWKPNCKWPPQSNSWILVLRRKHESKIPKKVKGLKG